MIPIGWRAVVKAAAVALALVAASPSEAQTLLERATARPSIGCATCFPKPAGIADAFDRDELAAAFKDGQAVVLAHDTELADESYEKAFVIEERFPLYGSLSRIDAGDMHVGHRNVARSAGGNKSPTNLCLEGAACNLSAGNRGAPSQGMSCAERGSCGVPYDR